MEQPSSNKAIKTQLSLVEKRPINYDCYIYKFKIVGEPFSLKIGEHLKINTYLKTFDHPEGEEYSHKYTPISPCSQKDTIDILFKIYRANTHPKFPHGGKMTTWIQTLNIGDVIYAEGPFGKFDYQPGGTIITKDFTIKAKRIFFIAGGSGITPCYQIIKQIINMKYETVDLILLFANKEEKDIILRKQLEELQPRLKLHFILDKGDENWKGFSGYATKQVLEKLCPLDDSNTVYIHCGPPPMNNMIKKMFDQHFPNSKRFKY